MSKAEELSRLYVLPFLDKNYEKYGEHKQMELTRFDGYDIMSAYEEGYHQAEKDLELTWKDIQLIVNIDTDTNNEEALTRVRENKKHYEEVLRRFLETKK